jgi:DNA mismatch repair protein MutL
MADVIHLLPDAVANQIAAGEVIQRPASVLKELVENSVDAGSSVIKVIIKDSGKTLIQVADNGNGMSDTDARMAFERHATSKIKSTDDLFTIQTFGFRGEALPSIVAVAQLELKSKLHQHEIGTQIIIHGAEFISQQAVSCSEGTNISVKNLFYNVPARRKFLKSDPQELKHIITEFQRIVLAHPEIEFSLYHNDHLIYAVPVSNYRQRINNVFGKKINQQLIPVETETSLLKLKGYIGKPEASKKSNEEQFFFVNNRFMKNPYLHKAVQLAYEHLLPADYSPVYFIYLEIDPQAIDVNIHPTKTEIKFENGQAVFQMLKAAVKEGLGKFNIVPSIDFDMDNALDIPVLKNDTEIRIPTISINSNYNPFDDQSSDGKTNHHPKNSFQKPHLDGWEKLYESFENSHDEEEDTFSNDQVNQNNLQTTTLFSKIQPSNSNPFSKQSLEINRIFFQLKGKYIATVVKSGMMFIDQKRAHERILFEKFVTSLTQNLGIVQKTLFPVTVDLEAGDVEILKEIITDLKSIGFDINEFGKKTFVINGIPAELALENPQEILLNMLENYKDTNANIKLDFKERIAVSLAKATAIRYSRTMNYEEMRDLIDQLFACSSPNYSPEGKPVIAMIQYDEIEKKF